MLSNGTALIKLAPMVKSANILPSRRLKVTSRASSLLSRSSVACLNRVADFEQLPNPTVHAINVSKSRVPMILDFDEGERGLLGEYTLSEVATNQPPALENLVAIGGLDLSVLLTASQIGDTPRVQEMEREANLALESAFAKTWSQSDIEVMFRLDSGQLKISIFDSKKKFSSFEERSDGLRQFVALRAFVTRSQAVDPILLIDEAEQHLHYDGQADLVQMFARQKVASKIIYSTHSAGCLPEDLGTSIRLIYSTNDVVLESSIQNKFWAKDHMGFSPLLIGMGATTLAFFPMRKALVGEGITETMLLPSLFREAASLEYLGFQVVPGLANVSRAQLPKLNDTGTHVAYFLDSDPEGEKYRKALKKAGIDEEIGSRHPSTSPINFATLKTTPPKARLKNLN